MSTATLNKELLWGDFIDDDDPSKGKYYPLHKYQQMCYNSPTRFVAAIAGTGGGKTVLGPIWCAKQIQRCIKENPTRPILGMVVAPTYKVLSRATVPTLIDTFKGTALEGTYIESRSYYRLPRINGIEGGKIWTQGADNPDGLEGGQFDFVWGDEAGQFKFSVWTAIQGRTGAKQAPILLTTTPYSKNWLFSDFYKRAEEGDKNYFVVQWSSYENPAYPDEEYQRAKNTMTKELGEMRYDGQFTNMQGLVYPDMSRCYIRMNREELEDLISGPGEHYGGLDYGWQDPFCALAGYLDKDDVLWVWYERYKTKTRIEDHADHMPKMYGNSIKWFSDTDPELIKKLQKGGHKVIKANKSLITGISNVNSRIYTGKLKILKNRCRALVAEAEQYAYPETEEISGGNIPRDEFNHALDPLRYMINGIDLRRAA